MGFNAVTHLRKRWKQAVFARIEYWLKPTWLSVLSDVISSIKRQKYRDLEHWID